MAKNLGVVIALTTLKEDKIKTHNHRDLSHRVQKGTRVDQESKDEGEESNP